MARGVNKVILVGNLGSDPEVRTTQSGVSVANVTLATNESWKAADGSKSEHTEWHRLVLWRGLAEVAEKYMRKGGQVYVEGRLRQRQFEGKDGQTRYVTEIEVDELTLLGGGNGNGNGSSSSSSKGDDYPAEWDKTDDLDAVDAALDKQRAARNRNGGEDGLLY